ncbi:beta-lactamase family protein [Aliifodinibius sp. S!AR15-10]|uniref:serine hydrolase domain-containing protein n=1 Tax=Aliifodinibius sp. S!AR15-10 TaxID=2950437 RepID=UPI0028568301|nr:serine hydrolase domain-containing protein [Aliifodinibius sp. S!AR15-10]MDR8391824.1 beta-lactamase family protein [Aliifodinibius sp. S!AR15-10]
MLKKRILYNDLRTIFLILILSLVPLVGMGQFQQVQPEAVGLSPDRLERLDQLIRKQIDEQKMAGVNTLILRDGKAAYFKSHGMMNIEERQPMQKDAIFRIASMSKAVTSVAVMILYEEGHFMLSDPVSDYIPAFKDPVVAVSDSTNGKGYRTVPAKRPITIQHLLTHTSGLTYGNGVAHEAYEEADLSDWYFADEEEVSIGEKIKKLATLPLHSQPGEQWQYGYSTDVLGYFVEVVSGMPLDEFFNKRIFEPLGMNDTHFFLPPEKADRLAPVYGINDDGDLELMEPTSSTDYIHGPRTCFSGGAGLMSTITDYGVFMQMLLNGGEFNGTRILSPSTVKLMHANHTGDMYAWGDLGFGLGFKVVEDLGEFGEIGTEGAYGWGSAYYPVYWIDPQKDMAFLFLTQLMPANGLPFRDLFPNMVYQAVVE